MSFPSFVMKIFFVVLPPSEPSFIPWFDTETLFLFSPESLIPEVLAALMAPRRNVRAGDLLNLVLC